MPCTTILVGRKASYDGSTMTARSEDSFSSGFGSKRFTVVQPEDQPRHYRSVISHVQIDLPDDPMRYTAVPNATDEEGIWGAAGVNACNVSMTATETITSNARVMGADPLVCLIPACDGQSEIPGGIGEEDMVTITLPYIHSAREGVLRLGSLLETYGTYERNGIAFQDVEEIWWLETIGGHHWIARRLPDECYAVIPNQLGLDEFDLDDALGEGREFLCSADMRSFIEDHHLDLSLGGALNPRDAFGSHSDSDHIYNTPRAWFAQRYLNPSAAVWDGPDADYSPASDDIPWSAVPDRKITVDDVKYILSSYYQGTPYNPYNRHGDLSMSGAYRPIGINRNNFTSIVQIRPYRDGAARCLEWLSFGSNAFNTMTPYYTQVNHVPAYLACTTGEVTTDSVYWANRIIAALADAQYHTNIPLIERYQLATAAFGYSLVEKTDALLTEAAGDTVRLEEIAETANQEMADELKRQTQKLLADVLFQTSLGMTNAYGREDG